MNRENKGLCPCQAKKKDWEHEQKKRKNTFENKIGVQKPQAHPSYYNSALELWTSLNIWLPLDWNKVADSKAAYASIKVATGQFVLMSGGGHVIGTSRPWWQHARVFSRSGHRRANIVWLVGVRLERVPVEEGTARSDVSRQMNLPGEGWVCTDACECKQMRLDCQLGLAPLVQRRGFVLTRPVDLLVLATSM